VLFLRGGRSPASSLAVTRRLLRVLDVANLTYGALILALLIASLLAGRWVMTALGVLPGGLRMIGWMRAIMVFGIAGVWLTHLAIEGLSGIVETVGRGDPFVAENAARLNRIAWLVLGLEALHLAVGASAAAASSAGQRLDLDWSLSPTRWVAVLMLFVLARVFEQGTRMREDLEGTV
jgi:hypothetical protein